MQTAGSQASDRIAERAPSWTLPDIDALLSELGVVHAGTYAGTEDEDDALQADAGEAPSGSSLPMASEERRSELDERIMAGLVRA